MAFCEHGSLASFLRKRAASLGAQDWLSPAQRLRAVTDIACGMEHLAAHEIIHRDLACRNVLVDSELRMKVADFGLSRTAHASTKQASSDTYYTSKSQGPIPVRHTAPEAMAAGRFTHATDVWSFGVTMFEVYTDAGKLYTGMDNYEVMRRVTEGYRLPKPEGCTVDIYSVMQDCWQATASERPAFSALARRLEGIAARHRQSRGSAFSNDTYLLGAAHRDGGRSSYSQLQQDVLVDHGAMLEAKGVAATKQMEGKGRTTARTSQLCSAGGDTDHSTRDPAPYGSSRKIGASLSTGEQASSSSSTSEYGRYLEGHEVNALFSQRPAAMRNHAAPAGSTRVVPASARPRRYTPEPCKLYGVVPRTGMTPTEYLPIGKMNPPPPPKATAQSQSAAQATQGFAVLKDNAGADSDSDVDL